MGRVMRKPAFLGAWDGLRYFIVALPESSINYFAYAKTKTQISFAVTAKLISAFVFAIRIVLSLYYLHLKFQASSHLLWLYRPVCVGPGRKPRRPVFSQRGSYFNLQENLPVERWLVWLLLCLCLCSLH